MLKETSTYEELLDAMRVVIDYGVNGRGKRKDKVCKLMRDRKNGYIIVDRVNTPAPHSYPAQYVYFKSNGDAIFLPHMIVEGKDKDASGKECVVDSFVVVSSYAGDATLTRR